jgi:anthraniloyl-CoA monooxygenase
MNVAVIGGGPAGLYCGILLKKTSPSRTVTVFERNPPDTTYGWGLVFSDRTLRALHEADAPSANAISTQFVLWGRLEVGHQGQRVPYGGQVFAGIARRTLLAVLRRRCEDLGVRLRFDTPVADLPTSADADILIAADGARSAVRDAQADVFQPRVEESDTRYIWFGTPRFRDAYTVSFRRNEHGLFSIHAYPFEQTTSAVIIECDSATWRRARLDVASEAEGMAYCERLFSDELAGIGLLSNGSGWTTFPTVTCAKWSHRHIVLVGDAAHTAHFAIGSGAKLAMEDAIALTEALSGYSDLDRAFLEYETARRTVVEAVQRSARESQSYFENLPNYLHLEPMQFAFHLLTRDGWASYDSLRARDPSFVDAVNRWFTAAALSRGAAGNRVTPPLLTPLRVRGMDLANRVAMISGPSEGSWGGVPSEVDRASVETLAALGAGLVVTEPLAVSADGRAAPAGPCLYDDTHVDAWTRVARTVHEYSQTRLAVCLTHAGCRGSRLSGPLISASALPYAAGGPVPREMTRDDMARVLGAFEAAARRALVVGADVLTLHAGSGYLLGSFISPLTNRRTDAYGGTIAARMRFPLEVAAALRHIWPAHRPLIVAFTADDGAPGGLDAGDAVAAAGMFKECGVDILHVLTGQTTGNSGMLQDARTLTALCDRVRNEAGVLVLASGFLTTTDQINSLLAAGRADLCVRDAAAGPIR